MLQHYHQVAPESDLIFDVRFTHLNGRGALWYTTKRKVRQCAYGTLGLCVQGGQLWAKNIGCTCPAFCCPCCYVEIPIEEPAVPGTPTDEGDVLSYVSSDDEEPEIARKRVSLLDDFDEETESERLRRIAWEKTGARALFGKGTRLQQEEAQKDLYTI